MKVLRNLNFSRLLPTVDVRPEYVVICEGKYSAAFLLRIFERKHIFLFDELLTIETQKHVSIDEPIKQKWTAESIVHELGAVYRKRGLSDALKYLHKQGFIKHEYARNGKAFLGHNVYFHTENIQRAIDSKMQEIRALVETGMGTDKVREHPKAGRPFGSKNKVKNNKVSKTI